MSENLSYQLPDMKFEKHCRQVLMKRHISITEQMWEKWDPASAALKKSQALPHYLHLSHINFNKALAKVQ